MGTTIHVPLWLGRDVTATPFGPRPWVTAPSSGGGNLVESFVERTTDLLSWSSCVAAGAAMLTGLTGNYSLVRTSRSPEPTWVAETGFSPSTDPEFSTVALANPRRLAGMTTVSRQLLLTASPGLDQIG